MITQKRRLEEENIIKITDIFNIIRKKEDKDMESRDTDKGLQTNTNTKAFEKKSSKTAKFKS